jgi:hypothetical protein
MVNMVIRWEEGTPLLGEKNYRSETTLVAQDTQLPAEVEERQKGLNVFLNCVTSRSKLC